MFIFPGVYVHLNRNLTTVVGVGLWVLQPMLVLFQVGLLLGKLHINRCVLEPQKTHLGKKARLPHRPDRVDGPHGRRMVEGRA